MKHETGGLNGVLQQTIVIQFENEGAGGRRPARQNENGKNQGRVVPTGAGAAVRYGRLAVDVMRIASPESRFENPDLAVARRHDLGA